MEGKSCVKYKVVKEEFERIFGREKLGRKKLEAEVDI